MKKLIIASLLAIMLGGCTTSTHYLFNASEAADKYAKVEAAHEGIVEGLVANKDKFTQEELDMLRFQSTRISAVRELLRDNRSMDSDLAKAIADGSKVLEHYNEVKDAYSIAIMIIEPKADEMPLALKFAIKKQIADARALDKAVMNILSSSDGVSYKEAIEAVLKLVGVAAKIAVAVG